MSYADIAAVVALFFTAFTFAFTMWQWNRRRKSEQIRIAREIMDRIVMKGDKDIYEPDWTRLKEEELKSYINEYSFLIGGVLSEVEYFIYLIKSGEIEDKNILKYYCPRVENWLQIGHIQFMKTISYLEAPVKQFPAMAEHLDALKKKDRYVEAFIEVMRNHY